MDGICQIHQGNGLAGFGLLFQIGYRGLLTIVDDTVNHAVVIFRGHFRCLQVVLFLEIRQLFETHAVAVMVGYHTVLLPMFKVVSVFDVSQTDGKPLPQISFSLTGDVAQYEVFMEALRRTSQVPITIEPMEPGMDGYFHLEKQAIFLREGMSQVQTVCAAIHEMAHSRLHNYEKMTELADDGETILVPGEKDRNTEEVEAESISYAVCQYFGIETADSSFGYIASWSQGKALKELRASLETINKTSSELISGIEQHYREICKEKGIDLAADAPAQEQPQVPDNAELPKPDAELEITSQQVETPVPLEASSPAAPEQSSSMLPDAAEQALDEYPMPDESVKVADLKTCGYVDGDMLSLSRERAVELYDQDMTVYAIVDGGNAEMLFDREELDTQASGTVFSVSREEWEQSPMFHEKIVERQQHQEKRENAFLDHGGDCFAIYQVKRDDPGNVRFMNMDWMQSHGKAIARGSYDLIYTAPLTATGSTDSKLEAIFEQFNLHRPADYHSPSLSVSDIVAINGDFLFLRDGFPFIVQHGQFGVRVQLFLIHLDFVGGGGKNLDALFALFHMTPEAVFPLAEASHQRGIRALGVDQHDIVQGILVKAAHSGEVVAVAVTFKQLHDAFFDTSGDLFDALLVGLFFGQVFALLSLI